MENLMEITERIFGKNGGVCFDGLSRSKLVLGLDAEPVFLARFEILDDVLVLGDNSGNFLPQIGAIFTLLHHISCTQTPQYIGSQILITVRYEHRHQTCIINTSFGYKKEMKSNLLLPS